MKTENRATTAAWMGVLLLLVACRAGSIVVPPDCSGDLAAALIESGRTGATVELSGVYVVTNQLITAGARIRGTHGSHHGDWNIGGTVLHFRMPPTNGCVRVTQGPTGNASVIESVAMVFYHQATPEANAVALDGASYGSVLRNVLLDRPGRGLVFEPSTPAAPRSLGHRFHDLTIQSFRSSAIYAEQPSRTTDHYFTGLIYLKGSQGADYVAGAEIPQFKPVGIDGLMAASCWDNVLIETCGVAIRTREAINARFKDLFVDDCRGVVWDRGPAYTGRHYVKTVRVGLMTAQAGQPKCVFAVGNPRQKIECAVQELSTCRDGASWSNWLIPFSK